MVLKIRDHLRRQSIHDDDSVEKQALSIPSAVSAIKVILEEGQRSPVQGSRDSHSVYIKPCHKRKESLHAVEHTSFHSAVEESGTGDQAYLEPDW